MAAVTLSFIVGIIGNAISILVFLSPVKTFVRVIQKRSTEEFKAVPYIATLLSTSFWTFYGLLKPNGLLVVTVNAAGSCLQFIYILLFITFAPRDKKVKAAVMVAFLEVAFLGSVIAATLLGIHKLKLRLTYVGILCACLTIGMYGAPLLAMRLVVKTNSVEYMPFLLSFFLFLNGAIWSVYSVLVKDIYIGVPNAVGFVLGSAQLILYVIYRNKPKPRTKPKPEEEKIGETEMQLRCENSGQMNGKGVPKSKSISKSALTPQRSLEKTVKTLSI